MILIEKTEIMGFEQAIRGMRNPMNSWDKSDSGICKGGQSGIGCINCAANQCSHGYNHSFQIGKNDHELMMKLVKGGPVHAKFRRMIAVYVDITAPLYWWKEFDTYKVGTVANSCSTMHKIHEKEFTLDDFSIDHLEALTHIETDNKIMGELGPTQGFNTSSMGVILITIDALNIYRKLYLETKDKIYWWQMIQLLPSSYNQKRTIVLNYEVLAGIYPMRKNHKLDEWKIFCEWVEDLPWSEIIIGQNEKEGVYKVVTLCGSTKFKDDFITAQKTLTLSGHIVFSVGLFSHSDDIPLSKETEAALIDMHKRKIDMSDCIFVINRDDYIGKGTASEIAYAKEMGKAVHYMFYHEEE